MKKISSNIILTLIVFTTTALVQIIFTSLSGQASLVPSQNYISFFIFLFLFSFIQNKKIRFTALNLILILSLPQMLHISFFGVPVYPNAIWLLIAESSEMMATLVESLGLFLIPLIIFIPAFIINIIGFRLLSKRASLTIPYLHFLFFFYLIYNPARTYKTGNTWGRQPSTQEFLGMNTYLSLSYFLGKILPYKVSQETKTKVKLNIDFTKKDKFNGNIIFVIGESLSANHLSLFGYNRATTPFLDSLKETDHFIFRRGIASGVSTDVAVAFLMNITFGHYGVADILAGKKCLNKLAKDAQFETHFYSAQSQQQLRYITNSICLTSVNHYKNLDILQPKLQDPNKVDDKILITALKESLTPDKNHFYVLHQRGSHSPYNKRYPKEFEIYPNTGNYNQRRINQYDNSVHYFDSFMQELISFIDNQKKETLLIYVSDHGEGLGEESVWGHAALKRPSIDVPLFIYSNRKIKNGHLQGLPTNPTHMNTSLIISDLLGHKPSLDLLEVPQSFIIYGNDMDGFAGYLETSFENGVLKKINQKNL